jgi:hypothetical protein
MTGKFSTLSCNSADLRLLPNSSTAIDDQLRHCPLQEKLGVKLFELKGRKAHLTELGHLLLANTEPHLAGFHQLEQKALSLASGEDSEIRLSVDSIFPTTAFLTLCRNSGDSPLRSPQSAPIQLSLL